MTEPPYSRPQGDPAPPYSRFDQQAYAQYQYYGQPYVAPPPPPAPNRGTGRSLLIGFGAALTATALVLGGVALTSGSRTVDGSGTALQPALPSQPTIPANPNPNAPGNGSSSSTPSGRSGAASATQQIGVVTIVSTLKYQQAQSAGTGTILTSDGEVLTNNHVIRGATSIAVTVETTGRAYKATVIGTAPGSDVAMIKLQDASGLQTAKYADSAADVKVGDKVVGVGNGGGTGTLTAAAGKVTALDQSITASDENGQESERLTGLIEVDAKIISGDSGGPLYDADGEIIGMNTAASASRSASPSAYAIPIEDAKDIVQRIESGVETTDIHIGYPGFLGVTTEASNGRGAAVTQLLEGGPAADAGITRGSVITAVNGKAVTSPQSLRDVLTAEDPGTKVKITWTDSSGDSESATVTLAVGPAD